MAKFCLLFSQSTASQPEYVAASDLAPAIAIFSGAAGIVSAVGGIMLAVRAVRSKERKAAKAEIDELGQELSDERHKRLMLETQVYRIKLFLREHGFVVPQLDEDLIEISEIEDDGDEPHQLGS